VATATDLQVADYASYLEIITAQRNVLDAELTLAELHQAQLLQVVALYRALGGGWSAQPPLVQSPDSISNDNPRRFTGCQLSARRMGAQRLALRPRPTLRDAPRRQPARVPAAQRKSDRNIFGDLYSPTFHYIGPRPDDVAELLVRAAQEPL
jgi:hypothetical protein